MKQLRTKGKIFMENGTVTSRIAWIDFAKGILILLVILGHTTSSAPIRGAIYSFHMPSFFILSGMTMKWYSKRSDIAKSIRKLFTSLIIPAIFLLTISLSNEFIVSINKQSFSAREFLLTVIEETIWAGGTHFKLGKYYISADGGMYWFLIVLFGDKVALYLINLFSNCLLLSKKTSMKPDDLVNIIVMIAACTGIWLGSHNFWLPFALDLILATVCFLSFGHFLRRFMQKGNVRINFLISLFLWLISFAVIGIFRDAYLDIKIRRFPLFPICYICALFGSLALFYFSQILSSSLHFYKVIQYIGRHSLVLFCIHMWDSWYCDWFAGICRNIVLQFGFRILVDVTVLFVVVSLMSIIHNTETTSRTH